MEWVVPDLFVRGDRLVIVGSGGSGKTTVLRQGAVLMSQGVFPFPGLAESWQIAPVRVLHVDCENPPYSTTTEYRKLREAIQKVHGLTYDPDRLRVWERMEGLDLTKAANVSLLAAQIEHARPDVVCVGPIYKLVRGDLSEQDAVTRAVLILDELRARFDFVLLIEGHTPHEGERPFGSSVWGWWPEFGRALLQDEDDESLYHLKKFRGDRHEALIPKHLRRGREWPWEAA